MTRDELVAAEKEATERAAQVVAASRVYAATPSGNGQHVAGYTVSLLGTQAVIAALGGGFIYQSLSNEGFLLRSRNRIVADFLASTGTHLLMADADMAWDPRAVVRLLAHEEDFVAGAYLRKEQPAGRWAVSLIEPVKADRRGLLAAKGVGMGFCLVSRGAIEKMVEAEPLTYRDSLDGTLQHLLFDRAIVDGQLRSEDNVFCAKWRGLGGAVYIDPFIELEHIGQNSWKARLSDIMRPVVQDNALAAE